MLAAPGPSRPRARKCRLTAGRRAVARRSNAIQTALGHGCAPTCESVDDAERWGRECRRSPPRPPPARRSGRPHPAALSLARPFAARTLASAAAGPSDDGKLTPEQEHKKRIDMMFAEKRARGRGGGRAAAEGVATCSERRAPDGRRLGPQRRPRRGGRSARRRADALWRLGARRASERPHCTIQLIIHTPRHCGAAAAALPDARSAEPGRQPHGRHARCRRRPGAWQRERRRLREEAARGGGFLSRRRRRA